MTRARISAKHVMACLPFGLALVAGQAEARPRHEECAGILHQDAQTLRFGGAPGEGEGICVIAAALARKVLAACTAGAYCRVVGDGAACVGSGECTEIKRIVSVSRKAPRRR